MCDPCAPVCWLCTTHLNIVYIYSNYFNSPFTQQHQTYSRQFCWKQSAFLLISLLAGFKRHGFRWLFNRVCGTALGQCEGSQGRPEWARWWCVQPTSGFRLRLLQSSGSVEQGSNPSFTCLEAVCVTSHMASSNSSFPCPCCPVCQNPQCDHG